MFDPLRPDLRTYPLEFIKDAVGRQASSPPHFLFTPDTTLLIDNLESVFGGPVILLDSRLDDDPQLIHTLQIKTLESHRLENPSLLSENKVLERRHYKATEAEANANPTAVLFQATRYMLDLMPAPREHRTLVLTSLQAPETISLISNAIRLQNFAYTYAPQAENHVEKLEVVSETQLYCIFFAFVEYAVKIRPDRTYDWLETVFTSLAGAAGHAADYL
ncbi:hypothetical protein ONZ45_g14136 [Pleurotus djamor]|nr:hypothetical protein ONZ45_g14136 [Pleurotus djamor]